MRELLTDNISLLRHYNPVWHPYNTLQEGPTEDCGRCHPFWHGPTASHLLCGEDGFNYEKLDAMEDLVRLNMTRPFVNSLQLTLECPQCKPSCFDGSRLTRHCTYTYFSFTLYLHLLKLISRVFTCIYFWTTHLLSCIFIYFISWNEWLKKIIMNMHITHVNKLLLN